MKASFTLGAGAALPWALLGALLALPGCEGDMQEPWIFSPDELQQERSRSPEQMKELRERLVAIQTDR